MNGNAPRPAVDRAFALAGQFWRPATALGVVQSVVAEAMPASFRDLLDHRSHMTVAMERHHGGPVKLQVLDVADAPGSAYAREILLTGPKGDVVQYGIVRVDLSAVDAATASAIRAGRVPLGRLLIEAGMFRDVQHVSLLEVQPGPRLTRLFGAADGHRDAPLVTFGRVAEIALNGVPAIELLEIPAPVSP